MDYTTFLDRIIDEGITAARADYGKPGAAHKLEGAIEGFVSCRGKQPAQLAELLAQARSKQEELYRQQANELVYWKQVCFAAEVEWVCNVVSAALMNQGQPTIVPPTARGVMKAAEILGVRQ